MWRASLVVAAAFSAVPMAQAATLILPTNPGAFAVAIVDHGSSTVELREPAAYTGVPPFTDGAGSAFGKSGDLEGDLAVIGAPAAWGDGIAFVYDANTGVNLHWLSPSEDLNGGVSRPQMGHEVMFWNGLVVTTAPNAGLDPFEGSMGRGGVFVFDPHTGQQVQTIWGPNSHWGLGYNLNVDGGKLYASAYNWSVPDSTPAGSGYRQDWLELAIVPEPTTTCLTLLGVLACGCSRRARV